MSSGKKLLFIVVLVLLLAAIPATVYLLLQQQELRGGAAPATTLSFDPPSVSKTVGETFTLTVNIDTGTNSVTGAELHVQFDSTKLTAVDFGLASNAFLERVVKEESITGGFAFIALSQQLPGGKKGKGPLATITFRATAQTGGAPTQIKFTSESRVAAAGEGSVDVLANRIPAAVTVNPVGPTGIPTPTVTPTPRPGEPTATPTPRGGGVQVTPTRTPTATPSATPTFTPTPTQSPQVVVPTTTLPTKAPIPVSGDAIPTTVITTLGILLFLLGGVVLLAL